MGLVVAAQTVTFMSQTGRPAMYFNTTMDVLASLRRYIGAQPQGKVVIRLVSCLKLGHTYTRAAQGHSDSLSSEAPLEISRVEHIHV